MFYIYLIINTINYKVYVGRTNNPHNRWLAHKRDCKNSKKSFLIHKAMNKHGLYNFTFNIIQIIENETECKNKEVYWIDYFKCNVIRYGLNAGYNMTDGGEGLVGYKLSKESREKISKALKGRPLAEEHKSALSRGGKGKILSEEHKSAIRIAGTGKKRTDESKKKISNAKLGNLNPQAKLTEEQVIEIKKLFDTMHTSKIAELYKVAPRTIRDIKNKMTWKHI